MAAADGRFVIATADIADRDVVDEPGGVEEYLASPILLATPTIEVKADTPLCCCNSSKTIRAMLCNDVILFIDDKLLL